MENQNLAPIVRIKPEPLSPTRLVTNTLPVTNIKKEPGTRLASFKPPRDLSLGGTGTLKNFINPAAVKVTKKVFTPNVNIIRKKPQSNEVQDSSSNSNEKIITKNSREKRNRAKPSYVQTEGVFSQGLAPGAVKPHASTSFKSDSTSSSSAAQMEKPKLNLNKKVSKTTEDGKMKDLMNDTFIDDPASLPDLSYIPYTLPRVYNVKSEPTRDIDKTFSSFQIKTEKIENIKKEEPHESSQDIGLLDVFEPSNKPKLLVFEFPQVVKIKEEPNEKKSKQQTPAVEETSSKMKSNMFAGVGEGLWGTLRIHANGRAYFVVNDRTIPISVTKHPTRQDLISARIEPNEVINLGRVDATFNCSTNFNC